MNDQTFCFEYSASQNDLRVTELEHILQTNYFNAVQGKPAAYTILHVGTQEECDVAASLFNNIRSAQPVKRAVSGDY